MRLTCDRSARRKKQVPPLRSLRFAPVGMTEFFFAIDFLLGTLDANSGRFSEGRRIKNRPMPTTLAPEQQEQMLSAARAAFKNAHAPYSNFRVGSAILTERGTLYSGCNVENASYGLTICAERNAIFAAVFAEGSGMRIKAVAVATERDGPCAPCGACRQVIFEFGPDAVVLFRGQSGTEQMAITQLLPEGFRL
jgi:cytidine deaminase